MKKQCIAAIWIGIALVGFSWKPVMSAGSMFGKIFTAPRFGEYCTDPAGWVEAGFKVGIWAEAVPVKAQALGPGKSKDQGALTLLVPATKEKGPMSLTDPVHEVYEKSPTVPLPKNYVYGVSAKGMIGKGTIYRAAAGCDSCHATPPGHISVQGNWGKCRDCHDLGVKVHTHAVAKAAIADNGCTSCHPKGCLDKDVHKSRGLDCASCHGGLSNVMAGTFKISGQAGKPKCGDCHDSAHREPKGGKALFADSTGHGGMLCLACHGSPHRVVKPTKLGAGRGDNCSGCHLTEARAPNMGPNCGECHGGGTDPHLAKGGAGNCLSCHAKEAKAPNMGPNCLSCHKSPHGAGGGGTTGGAAGASTGGDCLSCHAKQAAAPNMGPNCLSCHTNPHASSGGAGAAATATPAGSARATGAGAGSTTGGAASASTGGNCLTCHAKEAAAPNMGPNCLACHTSPH